MSGVDQVPAPETGESDRFPEGMRVLAVDDNMVCLKMLAALLKQCRYKVTTTTEATEALKMLRANKNDFDIVITDVHMLDMDGFKLLEIIGVEMDLPVIMMSSNDDKNTVMKGIKHGARDYLLKPVRVEEIKNIWQHVIRKTLSDPNKTSVGKGPTDFNLKPAKRNRERSKLKEEEKNIQLDEDALAQKKQRIDWSPALHDKFINAVQRLGVDRAVPKKILELMNEPLLTRENVASHLQKFRNAMKKSNVRTSESNERTDPNGIGGHPSNRTILSFDKQSHHSMHHRDRFGVNGYRNPEMIQFGHHIQNPGSFGFSGVSPKTPLLPLNHQDVLFEQYPQTPEMTDQVRQIIPAPELGVVSNALRMKNSCQMSDFNGLIYQNSRYDVVNNYFGVSTHIPSHSACRTGDFPLVGCTSNSEATGIFLDATTSSCTMLGDVSTNISAIVHHDSIMGSVQNFHPGQDEGINTVSCNEREEMDFRGQITEVPLDMKGSTVENFIVGDPMKLEQQHQLLEHFEAESNFQLHSCSSIDDDLNAAVKQFHQ